MLPIHLNGEIPLLLSFIELHSYRELLTWSSYSITSKVPSPAPPHHLMSQVSLLFGTN